MPIETRPLGRDVGAYDRLIDYAAFMADPLGPPLFVLPRSSIGLHYRDPYFARNWSEAKGYGLARSGYHVIHPKTDAKEQMDNAFRMAPEPGEFGRRILDLELNKDGSADKGPVASPKHIADVTWLCSEACLRHDGNRPILYSRANLIAAWLVPFWTQDELNAHFYILAQYLDPTPKQKLLKQRPSEHPGPPDIPPQIRPQMVIIQQTGDHQAPPPGVYIPEQGKVAKKAMDRDRWLGGDERHFRAWIQQHGSPSVVPTPPIPPPTAPRTKVEIAYDPLAVDLDLQERTA